jgi:hypothetical protein
MDYQTKHAETDVLALESALTTLAQVREQLQSKTLTQSIALEADRLVDPSSGQFLDAYFSGKQHEIALESLMHSIWQKIKEFFGKIIEYLKRFWMWITGQSNKVDMVKIDQAEKASAAFDAAVSILMNDLGQMNKGMTGTPGSGVPGAAEAHVQKESTRDNSNATDVDFKETPKGGSSVDLHTRDSLDKTMSDPHAKLDLSKGAAASKSSSLGDDIKQTHEQIKADKKGSEAAHDTVQNFLDGLVNQRAQQKAEDNAGRLKKFEQLLQNSERDLSAERAKRVSRPSRISELEDDVDYYKKSIEKLKTATESISLEDAGLKAKPSDVLRATILAALPHFKKSLTHAELYVIFSTAYTDALDKFGQQFVRSAVVKDAMHRFHAFGDWQTKMMGEAARVDGVKDFSQYRVRLDDFQHMFEEDTNKLAGGDGSDKALETLMNDVKAFYNFHEGYGDPKDLENSNNADALLQRAGKLDACFRSLKHVFPEVQNLANELKDVEGLFEKMKANLDQEEHQQKEGNHGARDLVLHRMQSEAAWMVQVIRTVTKGVGAFPLYFKDAHTAIVKYQRMVMRVFEDTIKSLRGEYEFQEEQIKSSLAKLRDASNAFARLAV